MKRMKRPMAKQIGSGLPAQPSGSGDGAVPPASKKSNPDASAAKDKSGSVSERLARTLFDEKLSDVTFLVGPTKEKVLASKFVLTSVSEVFEQMFFGDVPQPVPVLLPDATPEAFRAIVKYAYTDNPGFNGENVANVLYLAKKYMMNELYEKAVRFAKHVIDASTVLDFLELSGCMPELNQSCIDVIVDSMLESEVFLTSLDKTIVARILDQDSLPVTEIDLFNLCVRWAKAKLQNRSAVDNPKAIRAALGELLYKVRFPTMDIGTFTGQPTKSGVLTNEECVSMLVWYGQAVPPKQFSVKPRNGAPKKLTANHAHTYSCTRCKMRRSSQQVCARFLKCDHCGMASTNAV